MCKCIACVCARARILLRWVGEEAGGEKEWEKERERDSASFFKIISLPLFFSAVWLFTAACVMYPQIIQQITHPSNQPGLFVCVCIYVREFLIIKRCAHEWKYVRLCLHVCSCACRYVRAQTCTSSYVLVRAHEEHTSDIFKYLPFPLAPTPSVWLSLFLDPPCEGLRPHPPPRWPLLPPLSLRFDASLYICPLCKKGFVSLSESTRPVITLCFYKGNIKSRHARTHAQGNARIKLHHLAWRWKGYIPSSPSCQTHCRCRLRQRNERKQQDYSRSNERLLKVFWRSIGLLRLFKNIQGRTVLECSESSNADGPWEKESSHDDHQEDKESKHALYHQKKESSWADELSSDHWIAMKTCESFSVDQLRHGANER